MKRSDAVTRAYVRMAGRRPWPWVEGMAGVAAAAAGSLLVAGVMASAPRVEQVVSGLLLRAALVVVGVVGLSVHGSVLRGTGRGVLSLLPVDPWDAVRAELGGVALTGAWSVLLAGLALAPLWIAAPRLWGPGMLLLVGAAVAAGVWSTISLLGAVSVAEDPAWEGVLDALRGPNPRAQAAIIYALAPMMLGLGALVGWGAAAAGDASGGGVGWLVLAPAAAAAVGAPWMARLSRRAWFPATMVLAEIQARYAGLQDVREALAVAMDFTLRWLPPRIARRAALELRYGWRERRGRLVFAWAVALAAVSVAWGDAPDSAMLGGFIAGGGAWLGVVVLVERSRSTHPWLRVWLADPWAEAAARWWCVLAWASGPVSLLATLVLFEAGLAEGGVALVAGMGHALVAGAIVAGLTAREAWA